MITQNLLSILLQDPELLQIPQQIQFGRRCFALTGLTPEAKPAYLAILQRLLNQPILYIGSDNQHLEDFRRTLEFFHKTISNRPDESLAIFPSLEPGPYSRLSPHAEVLEQRALTFWRLFAGQLDFLLCPPASVLARLPRLRERFADLPQFAVGAEHQLEKIVEDLLRAGYVREDPVINVGSFSNRGGILDIFPPTTENPVRIEFFGDEVESLREFSVKSQRSIGPVQKLPTPPMREFFLDDNQLRSWAQEVQRTGDFSDQPDFLENELSRALSGEHFPGCEYLLSFAAPMEDTLFDLAVGFVIVFDEPAEFSRWHATWWNKVSQEADDDLLRKFPASSPKQLYLTPAELALELRHKRVIFFDQLGTEIGSGLVSAASVTTPDVASASVWQKDGDITPESVDLNALASIKGAPSTDLAIVHCDTRPVRKYHGNIKQLVQDVERHLGDGQRILFVQSSLGKAERLYDILQEYQVPCVADIHAEARETTSIRHIDHSSTTIVVGSLASGFDVDRKKLVCFGDNDVFDEVELLSKPVKSKSKSASFISDFRELKPLDYVVHIDHGIGQFIGTRQMASEGLTREFMVLNYYGDAKLYVPLERLDLIQKHSSGQGVRPQLDKLGGVTWIKTKSRIKKSMKDMAEELLKLYAERRLSQGFVFTPHGHWHEEFEEAFEFTETTDQSTAIQDVYRDMEAPVPMDRLLCGDVGFGKTEVAMRAAFKAAFDGKQVAVLAPTTILVYQHYLRFTQRFTAFPMKVEMLSRFRSAKEQVGITNELSTGKIDIIVGTHRLLSKDVQFRDLGLLIVDEEQQFGVAHKERLKQLKLKVDTLTMTATPIPRTLHMSLLGIRDMSVIETPPRDRLAIQTVVVPFSKQVIQNALEQELARNGQVYFVHNRVESIYSVAGMIQRICPSARILVAHGQMAERELESTMLRFVKHEADVLISTTIIENGLDIPLVNTLVVNRADRFGLAQLYQLRGRVGRSNRPAYAYLLTPPDKALSGVARQRLAALKEFSDLGSGFKIAALDLELRGAGNLLGGEQHGHINAIGFDLYCQMLERTMEEVRGNEAGPELGTQINLKVTVKIPEDYISDETQRLSTYKRISSLRNDSDLKDLRNELEDRFGSLPAEVESLMEYVRVRLLAERLLVKSIEREREGVTIRFHENTPVQPSKLVELISSDSRVTVTPSGLLKLQSIGLMQNELFSAVRGVLLELAN